MLSGATVAHVDCQAWGGMPVLLMSLCLVALVLTGGLATGCGCRAKGAVTVCHASTHCQLHSAFQPYSWYAEVQLRSLRPAVCSLQQRTRLVKYAGRLSRILGNNTSALGRILGPPEAWGRAEGSSLTAQRPALRQNALEHKSSVKRHGAALHEDLQQKLRYQTGFLGVFLHVECDVLHCFVCQLALAFGA